MKLCLFALLAALVVQPLSAQSKVEPPVPVRTVVPIYPYELRREGIVGLVVVSCVVDLQGNVTELSVQRTTNVAFNGAALDAMKKWKFKPALLDGAPIAQRVVIPLKFIFEET